MGGPSGRMLGPFDLGVFVSDDLAPASADLEVSPEPEAAAPEVPETPTPEPTAAATPPASDDPFDRPFVNPAELPDELKPHWKSMHRAHNKKLDELRAHKSDLDMLNKFRSDPAYARELLQFEAARLGLQIASPGAQPTAQPDPQARQDGEAPTPQLVAAVKARLDPSLHWMAESLAAAGMEAAKLTTKPLVEKDRAKELAARDAEWGALSGKLTETAPGWEAHETDMNALLDWLRSPSLRHDQFGDKLTFLYNAVTGGAAAKAQAIRAMGDAARNATRTGQTSRATLPNTAQRVREAKTPREAMQVAVEAAEQELRASGHQIPD